MALQARYLRWPCNSNGNECRSQFQPLLTSGSAVDSRLFSFRILVGPGHARRVVRNAEAAALVEQNDAAVAVQPFLQILHGFLDDGVRRATSTYAVSGPFGQNQFHDGLAPTSA